MIGTIAGITKGVLGLAVSTGVGTIVANNLKRATPRNASFIKKASVGVGAFALSSYVGSLTVKYVDDQIDNITKAVTKTADDVKLQVMLAEEAAQDKEDK